MNTFTVNTRYYVLKEAAEQTHQFIGNEYFRPYKYSFVSGSVAKYNDLLTLI